MSPEERLEIAMFMREEWPDFTTFAAAGMEYLGFKLTWMQGDMCQYLQYGPRLRMLMAQRGEAKTTLTALYDVWRVVQDPSTPTLIVSAGEGGASETATLITRLMQTWDILDYLRPDRAAGDRTSVNSFDVHWLLKGINRSPSVACAGITATLQGKRAGVLIADDVESTKNSLTAAQRGILLRLTQEFTSINTSGDVIYLGTPQTKDSIYNTLEGRGFEIRIWPGRYPTTEEVERYGSRLAPAIIQRMQADPTLQYGGGIAGDRGKPTDPDRFDEAALQEKELDQGPEGFALQYMLDTSLMDAARQQLKLSDLVISTGDPDFLPEAVAYQQHPTNLVPLPQDFPVYGAKLYYAAPIHGARLNPRKEARMRIDPAGSGGDEIGFAVGCAVGPYIHILDAGGLKGGLTDENADALIDIMLDLRVTEVVVESNMGHGLFESSLRGRLAERKVTSVSVKSEYSTGQKERRIINAMVSPMQRHRLVIHPRVLESDAKYLLQHSKEKRKDYSLWHQISTITTDRNSLVHDDRIECVAALCADFGAALAQDAKDAARAQAEAEVRDFLENPMGYTKNTAKNAVKYGIRALLARRNARL